MSENHSHIISKFRWNTLFDKKERGSELQERLSTWSRINMPKEVTEVFDKVCPPEQTWRIQSLEIDLGLIDYNNLEFELSTKLRAQLNEKLIDLIIYANRGGRNLEILSEDTSHIYLISSFLLNGLMPWSYKATDGSVNEMLAYELQNNRQRVIEMLRSVGVTHENVRKRIAWQISEPNIIKIIEGLEPNNHTQIIEFSNELTKIQVKETVVQASTRDFKKQLWLWILNYLLTERGTVFNKVAYMKSTIRQMAAHYNIAYAELLALIERAVEIVGKNYGLKADFLQTIKAIIKEEDIHKPQISSTGVEDTDDVWETLSAYLKGEQTPDTLIKRKEFNELIVTLSSQNRSKFRELLTSINYNKTLYNNIFYKLNEVSLEQIFYALNENVATLIIETIHFLNKAGRKVNLNADLKALRQIALQFLYANQKLSIDNRAFLNYCIAEVAKSNGLSKIYLLDSLTNIKAQGAIKLGSIIDTYADLSAIYMNEAGSNSTFISIHFADLIEDLIAQLTKGIDNKAGFLFTQKSLLKNIRLYPKIALDTLIQYRDKDGLQVLLPYILDDYVSQALIKQTKISPLFVWLQLVSNEVKANSDYTSLSLAVEENLLHIALKAIIISPELKSEAILNWVFREFYQLLSKTQVAEINRVISQLIQQSKLPSLEVSTHTVTSNEITITEQINRLITSANKHTEVGNLLLNNFTDPEIVELIQHKGQLSSALLNYLIPQGEGLMDVLMKQYRAIITRELPGFVSTEIAIQLTELYWQSIADYDTHRGQTDRLKKAFKTAVQSQFNISDQKLAKGIVTVESIDSYLPQGKILMDLVIKEYATILNHILINITEAEIINRLTKLYKAALNNYSQHKGRSEALVRYFRESVLSEFSLSNERILPQLIHFKGVTQTETSTNKQFREALIKQYTLLLAAELKTGDTREIRLRLINLYQEMQAANTSSDTNIEVFAARLRTAVLSSFNITEDCLPPVIIAANKINNSVSLQLKTDFELLIKTYATVLYRVSSQFTEVEIAKRLNAIYKDSFEKHVGSANGKQLQVGIFKSAVEQAFGITDRGLLPVTPLVNLPSQQIITYHLENGPQLTEHQLFLLIEDVFVKSASVIKYNKITIKLAELIKLALDINPAKLRELIAYIPFTNRRLALIKSAVSFNYFALWIMNGSSGSLSQAIESIRILHDIVLLTASSQIANKLIDEYWQQSWKIIATGSWSAAELNKLVKQSLYQLTQQADVDVVFIKSVIQRNYIRVNTALQDALSDCSPAFIRYQDTGFMGLPSEQLLLSESRNLLYELSYAVIIQKQIPFWFKLNTGQDVKELLNELIVHHPAKVLSVLKQEVVPEQQMQWLSQSLNIDQLMAAITHLEKPKQSLLHIIGQLYTSLGHVVISGITAREMQYILFRKIIKAWSTDNWQLISAENIWNELLWDVCVKRGINKAGFIRDISKSQSYLPPSLLISFSYLKDQHNTIKPIPIKPEITLPIKKMLEKKNNNTAIKGGIPVKNAGMVLLNNYIPMLFERLGFTVEKKFLDITTQCNAVHYLQYVVTGLTQTEESLLPLNKVLCGVPLSHPIPDGITITAEQTKLINSLIEAIIGYWTAIGSTSIDGFRGNWLVRDGLLVELDERWELTVEKRAYDLLINKSPFSFSIIKYPWMDKPLHVQWPY